MKRETLDTVSEPFVTWDLATAADRIAAGFSVGVLDDLQSSLEITGSRLSEVLQIAPRTLARRRVQERLQPDESERAYRLKRLVEIAEEVLGGPEDARQWMKEPNFSLGDRCPLDMARTEPGARLVENLLGQIAHGLTA